MSTSLHPHRIDLESANSFGRGCCCGRTHAAGETESGGPPPSVPNEILRVSKDNGKDKEKDEKRKSNVSECSVEMVDLESGMKETKQFSGRDCRICHLSIDVTNQESSVPFELGCSCKDDLAAAHRQCAEVWFKIKGNKTCEICGSIAQNIRGTNEVEFIANWSETTGVISIPPAAASVEHVRFWHGPHGRRLLDFMLVCLGLGLFFFWILPPKVKL